ncbi:hypothetical protein KAR91_50690 [Candidatus Pacearchaeota archaeon]|nr:hypothetical protein [Candidatus Pacearchaeota archaeon]
MDAFKIDILDKNVFRAVRRFFQDQRRTGIVTKYRPRFKTKHVEKL